MSSVLSSTKNESSSFDKSNITTVRRKNVALKNIENYLFKQQKRVCKLVSLGLILQSLYCLSTYPLNVVRWLKFPFTLCDLLRQNDSFRSNIWKLGHVCKFICRSLKNVRAVWAIIHPFFPSACISNLSWNNSDFNEARNSGLPLFWHHRTETLQWIYASARSIK